MRTDGGYSPSNQWLAYDADGTARFEGILDELNGRYRAKVDFSKVAQLVTDAGLCTRATIARPPGMDMLSYSVNVRCGDRWRSFVTTDVAQDAPDAAQVRRAVRSLWRMAAGLAWQPRSSAILRTPARATKDHLRARGVRRSFLEERLEYRDETVEGFAVQRVARAVEHGEADLRSAARAQLLTLLRRNDAARGIGQREQQRFRIVVDRTGMNPSRPASISLSGAEHRACRSRCTAPRAV